MTRRLGTLIAVLVLTLAVVVLAISWKGISVDATGQSSTLSDGTLCYTHRLVNRTWHPIRYVMVVDSAPASGLTPLKVVSSMPETMVTRTEPLPESGSPWRASVVVPGHQEASWEVQLRPDKSAGGMSVHSDMGGVYPTVTIHLRLER